MPKTGAGDTAYFLTPHSGNVENVALAGLLGSLVVDYAARQKSSRMKYFVVEQLPILPPKALSAEPVWMGNSVGCWLSERALELCYTNEEMRYLALDLGRELAPFQWCTKRRIVLQAELDAAVMHLYGLDRAQSEWLIDSFAVLRKYEERDHGEFRTKRIVLEIYDEMATARSNGIVYQTRLDPPPADERCCHA